MREKTQSNEGVVEKIQQLKKFNAKLESMRANKTISSEDYKSKKSEISKRFKILKQMQTNTQPDDTLSKADQKTKKPTNTVNHKPQQIANSDKQVIADLSSPYATPKATLRKDTDDEPYLWNPNAAANWSLLFSPIFGAFLQSKNWEALGDFDKAKASKMWIYISIATIIIGIILGRNLALILLIAWYVGEGRKQAKHIKDNNIDYIKKPWSKVLLIAMSILVVYVGIVISLIMFL